MAKALTIEEELRAAVPKVKPGKDRQEFLEKLAIAIGELKDGAWDKLSEPAQEWTNAAATAISKDPPKLIKDFAEPETDEDETPKKKAAADKPAKAKTKAKDEDEESEEPEDEEEEKPAAKKKTPAKKPAKKDEEEEDDKPAPKKKDAPAKKKTSTSSEKPARKVTARAEPEIKPEGIKVRIKKLILNKPAISVDELIEKLDKKGGPKMSKFTVANIRAEFRHSLKVLEANDHLKNLVI